MNPDKAPGPDGLNPGFFQQFRYLIGAEISDACLAWIASGSLPAQVNKTDIALIPKVEKPTSMKDLRLISLCNVLYRIITKTLANRMKSLMPKVIGPEQSAFVKGRSIVDNVMIAFEVLHSMKRRQRNKIGEVALKVDISKAFDRVEWSYLKGILLKLGFNSRWVNLIMSCITGVSFNVLINGERTEEVRAERGLRQGCPLSPFLFIICAEGLSNLLRKAADRGSIHGTRVAKGAPTLTHLFFADDSMFFFKAEISEARKMKEIFEAYAAASGQVINYDKSGMYITNSVHTYLKAAVAAILGIAGDLDTGRYLGMPAMVGRNKRRVFAFLRDRVWQKLHSWLGRKVSNGGREVLIKSVAQAIPIYCMNVFMIPQTIADEIQKMINSFWWGLKGNGQRGISWMKWERLCVRKENGSMGFRDFTGFNLALLGKQGWKLLSNPDALVTKVYKAKYFPHRDFLSDEEVNNPSVVWRSISRAQVVIRQGYRWRIGSDSSLKVWNRPWLMDKANFFVETPTVAGMEELTVGELCIPGLGEWDIELIDDLFNPRDAAEIKSLQPHAISHDVRIWGLSREGDYTVRSAYRMIMERIADRSNLHVAGDWLSLWNIAAPPRMKVLLWRIARGVLPTRMALQARTLQVPDTCGNCDREMETCWHMFLSCDYAKDCWVAAGLKEEIERVMEASDGMADWVFKAIQSLPEEKCQAAAAILNEIWRERNNRVWSNQR
ncbi:LINE-1 retrotransposable element ORF2 protein [Linum perenne]